MTKQLSSIQSDLRQNQPFLSRSQEAAVALLRTADVLNRHFTRIVEPFGITLQQFNVLRILRGAGTALPTMEIGERMVQQTPGVTRLLDRMEAKGLVVRVRAVDDRRQVLCTISQAGTELLARLDAPMNQADNDAIRSLEHDEQLALLAMLDKIRADLTP